MTTMQQSGQINISTYIPSNANEWDASDRIANLFNATESEMGKIFLMELASQLCILRKFPERKWYGWDGYIEQGESCECETGFGEYDGRDGISHTFADDSTIDFIYYEEVDEWEAQT